MTVIEGEIVNNRAYYYLKKSKINKTKNYLLDNLIENNLAECFSIGFEEDSRIIKHDLHIDPAHGKKIYVLLSALPFFDCSRIKLFEVTAAKRKFLIENRIIGAKINSDDNTIKNICLYYRCPNQPTVSECRDFLFEICNAFSLSNNFNLPRGADKHFLRLIALDFGDTFFKVKFYFQFQEDYPSKNFVEAFEGSVNSAPVKKIVESNGWIWGFQIATTNNKNVSYNFYIKDTTREP